MTESEITNLIDTIKDRGYFSEDRYRQARARQLTRRGDGPRSVKNKVKLETGTALSDLELKQVYEDLGVSSHQVLVDYLNKEHQKLTRGGRLESKQIQTKLVERALRKGFSYDQIKLHLATVLSPEKT